MAIALDILLLVVFGLSIWQGHRQGFIKTVAGLVAFIVALVLSSMLAAPVANWAYDTLIETPVAEALDAHLGAENALAEGLDAAFAEMPAFVTDNLAKQGIVDGQSAMQYIGTAEAGETLTDSVMRQVIRPVIGPLLKVICSLILFFLIQFLLSLLLKLLDLLAKLPLLKQLNKTLGVVAGLLQGILWVLLIATFLQAVVETGLFAVINQELLESTILVEWLCQVNPLGQYMMELFVVS